MGMIVSAFIGIVVGVSMLFIGFAPMHFNTASEYTAITSIYLGLSAGYLALYLLMQRRNFIKRAVMLTMAADYAEGTAERGKIAAQASELRDASIASGDLDMAYQLQDTISQLESE